MVTRYVVIGLGAILLVLASLAGVGSCRQRQGGQAEVQSAIHQGEANAHVQQAQAIPDHAAELQGAKDDVARARAEVARVKRLLAAQQGHAVPDQAGPSQTLPPVVDSDPRDQVIASQGVLIAKQDAQIQTLTVALTDEQARSEQFRLAFEAERKATAAQAAATEAWRGAVKTSRWTGRAEGAGTVLVLAKLAGLL